MSQQLETWVDESVKLDDIITASRKELREIQKRKKLLDEQILRYMVNNKINHAMVAAINQIGHIMDIQTIAEFVENDQIMRKLRGLNVDYAQGYAVSRPILLEDIDLDALSVTSRAYSGCA